MKNLLPFLLLLSVSLSFCKKSNLTSTAVTTQPGKADTTVPVKADTTQAFVAYTDTFKGKLFVTSDFSDNDSLVSIFYIYHPSVTTISVFGEMTYLSSEKLDSYSYNYFFMPSKIDSFRNNYEVSKHNYVCITVFQDSLCISRRSQYEECGAYQEDVFKGKKGR